MKKLLIISLLFVAVVAFAYVTIFACGEKGTTSAKAGCSYKSTGASLTSATGKVCTPEEMAACAKELGITTEELSKLCSSGKFDMKTISIQGMTCGGCENSISTALMKVDGVTKVVSISYKDELAVVCIDPSKTNGEVLTKLITDQGYKAEIIPAVSVSTGAKVKAGSSCSMKGGKSKACNPSACSMKKTSTEKKSIEGTK